MKYKVELTETAKSDLRDIALYLTEASKEKSVAIGFVNELRENYKKLEDFPQIGAFPKDRVLVSLGYRFLVHKDYLTFYIQRVMVFQGIGELAGNAKNIGAVKRLVFLEDKRVVVGDGTRLLGGHKVVVSFQLREVAQSHADGGGFGVLRQHQADALPGQQRFADGAVRERLLE